MRIREGSEDQVFPYGNGLDYSFDVKYRKIQDVNNGRSNRNRPESYCYDIKASSKPTLVPTNMGFDGALKIPASSYAGFVWDVAQEIINDHYDSLLKKMDRLINEQIGSFSTLNFLYELRELPDTFKKLKTPEDFRYIDWQFAIAPTLSDLRSALTQYNNNVASLNEKLKRYRSIECNGNRYSFKEYNVKPTWFSGHTHRHELSLRVKSLMRGTIEMDVPVLSQVCPDLFRLLDDLAIDVSASNAYNALPWSWFFDWFFPVGEFLERLPSAMKPETRFVGTLSHKVTAFSAVKSTSYGPQDYVEGAEGGTLDCKIYERIPFNRPRSQMTRWRMDSLSNPRQIALIRDIMFPADIQRGKSILR